ncbi:peptide chain release factor N(5)-glutamine methyltransferase [uncultured Winogradskyella sp.]|uniref:peptide chain release factor N(5)-glutamine methyltransferase n=1 Tax=uncultured Winogradskyella sp. TaxID=395353 RepID=UPI002635E26E|nr:peptide chain release factor N(5)-glutamine methyltransferase [uncultured Winogradskyella sp.]
MLLRELQNIFHKVLDVIYSKEEVNSFFFLCLEHYLDFPRFQLALQPEYTITKSETDIFFKILEDLKQQKPIQYIFGKTAFYGLEFIVNAHVLIPRPETEELVDWIIKDYKERNETAKIKILDIGTGSGCIAVSLAKHLQNAKVYSLDVSKEALNVAKQNAELNEVDIQFIEANILNKNFHSTLYTKSKFDIIVSNPPYVRHLEKPEIKSNVLDNEPHLALFVEDKRPLVFYETISQFATNNLKRNGCLYFEINQYLGKETKQILIDANYENIELRKDLNGNYRMLKGIKN